MVYTSAEARTKLLGDIAVAADELSFGIACLSEAYEAMDEDSAARLEEEIFRPAQLAYGRLKRGHARFAARHGLSQRAFQPRSPGTHSADPRDYLERAVQSIERTDQLVAELQDSMLPVEVGDPELRAELSASRALIAQVPARGRRLLRMSGR